MKIAMLYGRWSSQIHGKFDPLTLYHEKGLTGSESAFFNTAKGLASRGHHVDVFCDCTMASANTPTLAGANILPSEQPVGLDYDAHLTWNEPDLLREIHGRGPRICVQQLNDFDYCRPDFHTVVDYYVSPSQPHVEHLLATNPQIRREQMRVVPNSIHLEFYDGAPVKRDPYRMAYISSPDRGLHWLLDFLPDIRRVFPQATLYIYYQFQRWIEPMCNFWYDPKLPQFFALGFRARYIVECLNRLGWNGENGVHVVGNIANVDLATELRKTGVFAYPCDVVRWTESFSVATMDACAAGCVPIISDADALAHLYRDVAVVLPGPPGASRAAWVSAIIEAMMGSGRTDQLRARGPDFVRQYTWQECARRWERLLEELM